MRVAFIFRSVWALCFTGALVACGGGEAEAGPTGTADADRGVVPADQVPSVTSSAALSQPTDVELQQLQSSPAEPAANPSS